MPVKFYCLLIILIAILSGPTAFGALTSASHEPDSVYLFSYATAKNSNTNGLHFAWSSDQENWKSIGSDYRFLFCDYGRWGTEKKMISPFLLQSQDGMWHCIWSVNEKDGVFAHAASRDLVYWEPQSYPQVIEGNNCLETEVAFNFPEGNYTISWLSTLKGESKLFFVTTKDFKSYSQTAELSSDKNRSNRVKLRISGVPETGTVHKVSLALVHKLIQTAQISAYKKQLWAESAKTDSVRFAGLKPLEASISVDCSKSKKISDLLIGVFFEDINYAADGGLYAEMVQNRDFEYCLSDKEGKDPSWNSTKAWHLIGEKAELRVDTVSPIHPNSPHFARLTISEPGAKLVNEGFDGMVVKAGEKYNFSIFARLLQRKNSKFSIMLQGKNGEVYGQTSINVLSANWKKLEATLTAAKTATDAQLVIVPLTSGSYLLDMVSLFPQKTFKGHPNGLRSDLAQTIADIHPRFIRFPGGCVAHGDGLGNIYRWKNSIGPLESRKPQRNLWGYHQTAGLGYFEYFQFCDDIGAEPLPVLAAGVPCQNSATGGAGQQGGIPMCDMGNYVQEVLDLIEYANGDVKTTWGKKRAEAGHPKPFNLKYIGIGNEDLITPIFEERFTMILEAVREKYPEITVVGTVGPSFEGTDYEEGWKIATKLRVPMVDEHYYQSPGWFIHNQEYYDTYDRSKSKVYLGEYAAHLPGRPSNLETSLAEALYLTTLERNGDVVTMASYAPLLAKEGHTQWTPDLIYFNNSEIKPTVNYFVQQLFGQNAGNSFFNSEITLSSNSEPVQKRVACSVVHDSRSGDLIVKMVNLLPVSVSTKVKLKNATSVRNISLRTVLTGAPTDKTTRPFSDKISTGNSFQCQLPAYSLTIIRMETE